MLDKKITDEILEEIKKANSILLTVHLSPDGDAIGSALAMERFLQTLGKKTKIISSSKIPPCFKQFSGINLVEIDDFSKISLSEYDLFIALDCAQETLITRNFFPQLPPKLEIINIDHHLTNTNFGNINLIAPDLSSTCELLYYLFNEWKAEINKETAELLFLGIFTDTGCFQYPNTSIQTMRIAADLRELGANLGEIVLTQFRSYSFKNVKYWAKVLNNMQIDKTGKFVWSKVSRKEIEELQLQPEDMEGTSSLFCPVTEGTEFGIILDEQNGFVKASLRSRTGFDVSKIAQEFGGGGHKLAAGFIIQGSLAEAEEKVLEVARRLA